METIRDGKGRGFQAGVTQENMLMTRAMTISHEFHHSNYHANGFVCTTEHTMAASNTKEIVCTIEYNGDHQIVLSRVAFNADSAGLTDFYIYGGTTGLSGGTNVVLANTNSGSRNLIDCDVTGTDENTYPFTYTSLGVKMWEVFMGYHTMMHYDLRTYDSFIIKPGTFVTFVAKSTSAGDRAGINLFFYEESDIG